MLSDRLLLKLSLGIVFFTSCNGILKNNLNDKKLSHNKVVVCYVGTWAVYRPTRGSFNINHIDPGLCTHVVYAFVGLNATTNTIRSINPHFDLEENYGLGSLKKMTKLKEKYPHLKVTLAVGGWNEGSANYSTMAMRVDTRRIFIKSVVDFVLKYDFDGFDLDWEYPTLRGGRTEDKQNFLALVKELKAELSKHNLILTSAIGAAPQTLDSAYDIPAISKYLDLLHLMSYDYYGNWDRKVGSNAPLSGNPISMEQSIKQILKLGAPPEKLVVGLPAYGHTFIVNDNVDPAMGAPTMEQTFQGQYTRQDGFMGFNEICIELQSNKSWQVLWDENSSTPYAVNGDHVVAYDDERSIVEKVKTALMYNVGGLMIWSIDTDDFRGDCDVNNGNYGGSDTSFKYTYPLLRAVHTTIDEHTTIDNQVPSVTAIPGNSINSSGAVVKYQMYWLCSAVILVLSSFC